MSYLGPSPSATPLTAAQMAAGDTRFPRLDGANVPVGLFKNALINASFDNWQRGTAAASGFVADRWTTFNSGNGTVTTERLTPSPGENSGSGSTFALRLKQTGRTTGQAQLIQSIEGVRTFAGRRVVLTGWARSAAAVPNLTVTLDQNFGSGGSSFVSTPLGSIAISTVWTKFTASVVNIPSIFGKTIGVNNALYLNFYLPAADLQIDFMDIELKEVASGYGDQVAPFERVPPEIDLIRCQRFFEVLDGAASLVSPVVASGSVSRVHWAFKTRKRTQPTIVFGSGSFQSAVYSSPDYAVIDYTATASQQAILANGSTANAEF